MEDEIKLLDLNYSPKKVAKWKLKNSKYVEELQKFFDKTSNIEDKELQYSIVIQMLKCDEIFTNLSEKLFKEYFDEGCKKAKEE